MNQYLKYFLIFLGFVSVCIIVFYVVLYAMIFSAFGGFDKSYSASYLKEEYFSKEKEINDLVTYFDKIAPKDKVIDIEFKNDKVLERLRIENLDSSQTPYQQWGVQVASLSKPEFKKDLRWTEDEVKTLKEKLDDANCISIEDGEPMKIGFKRSGMGIFSFVIFKKSETDRKNYNNDCQYILVNNYLALEYGGGAVGPQYFPNKN